MEKWVYRERKKGSLGEKLPAWPLVALSLHSTLYTAVQSLLALPPHTPFCSLLSDGLHSLRQAAFGPVNCLIMQNFSSWNELKSFTAFFIEFSNPWIPQLPYSCPFPCCFNKLGVKWVLRQLQCFFSSFSTSPQAIKTLETLWHLSQRNWTFTDTLSPFSNPL